MLAAGLGFFVSNPIGANGATPISVMARGDAGGEIIELIADGKVIETFTLTKSLASYSGEASKPPANVRVKFINDKRENGVDRNVVVERVNVNGVDYSPTDPSVLSTGTYTRGQGCARGATRSVRLHCNGYFEFRIDQQVAAAPAARGTTRVEVRAKGETGEERIQLRAGNKVLATWNLSKSYTSYTHDSTTSFAGENLRVQFINDAKTKAGDRNAQVDFIAIDGRKIEAEDPSVYSTGTYVKGSGCDGANPQSEILHCGGYFQFSIPDAPADRVAVNDEPEPAAPAPAVKPKAVEEDEVEHKTAVLAATLEAPEPKPKDEPKPEPKKAEPEPEPEAKAEPAPVAKKNDTVVSIFASGTTGSERIELRIDSKTVARFTVSKRLAEYTWKTDKKLGDRSIAVHFVNDARTNAGDRNVTLDRIAVDGQQFQTEGSSVEILGSWTNGSCKNKGYHQAEVLTCNGFARFNIGSKGQIESNNTKAAKAAAPVSVASFPEAGHNGQVGCQSNCKTVGFQDLDGDNGTVLENLIITNSGGPCLSIQNASNITIRNVTLRNCATNGRKNNHAIVDITNSSNITITGSKFTNNSSRSVSKYNLIHIEDSSQVTIRNNEIRDVHSNTSGGRADNGNRAILATGNRTRNLVIEHNSFYNPGRNALQISRAQNLTGVRIKNNRIEGKARWNSEFEDMINFYSASGTSASPILVKGNYLRNGGPSASGTAIILGDGEGNKSSAYITVERNVIVDPGHVGINVAGGHHFIVRDNIIYGGSNVGRWTATGLTINHYRYTPECRDHQIYDNRVYFKNQHSQHNGTNHMWNPRTCKDNVKMWGNDIGDRSLSYKVWDLD